MPDARTRSEPERATAALLVRVRLFAHYRDVAGTGAVEMEVADGSTVRDLVERVRVDLDLRALPPKPLVAVNREYADLARPLAAGDEVALIPPVSGG